MLKQLSEQSNRMAVPNPPSTAVDMVTCESEPIHIPGTILPHGAMLVLDCDTLEVLQAAGDTLGLLGAPLEGLLGQSVEKLFAPMQIAQLRALSQTFDLTKPRHLLDPALRVLAERPLDASVHLSSGSLVLEFEAADINNRFANDPLVGVQEMVKGFDAALSVQELCQMAGKKC